MNTILVLQVAIVIAMLSALLSSLLIYKQRAKLKSHEAMLLELHARVRELESNRDQA